MTITIGMGEFVYEYHGDWARLPAGKSFQTPSAVAVDSLDRVYVFQRRGPPVLVFDRDGNSLAEWPRRDGELEDAHHIYVGPDDGVYLADRDAHQVLKYTPEGEMMMALGTRHQAALQAPFNHPSDIAVAPNGEIYIFRRLRQFQCPPVYCRRWVHSILRNPGQRPGPVPGASQHKSGEGWPRLRV